MGPIRARYQMYRELTRAFFETILTRIGCRHGGGIPAEVFFNGCAEEIMVTTKDLEAFFRDGWNRHDVDLLMTFMSDQCVFETTAGSEACGTRHRGRERVREAFAKVFSVFPDAQFGDARHFVSGDRGVSEWLFTGTTADGKKIEVNGCDLFTFANNKIVVKSSYFKSRSA